MTPRAPAKAPIDPLADLRGPEDDTPPDTDGTAYVVPVVEAVTPEEWDRLRALTILAWHNDTTALGFLHKGQCACQYLAGVALQAVVPVQANQEETDGDEA